MNEFIEIDGHRLTADGAYWDGPGASAPYAIGNRKPYLMHYGHGIGKRWHATLSGAFAHGYEKAVSAGWRLHGVCLLPPDVYNRKQHNGATIPIEEQWDLSVVRAARGTAMLSIPAVLGAPDFRRGIVGEMAHEAFHRLREDFYKAFGAPTMGVLDEFQRATLADEVMREVGAMIEL